jgi:hypothetical protein
MLFLALHAIFLLWTWMWFSSMVVTTLAAVSPVVYQLVRMLGCNTSWGPLYVGLLEGAGGSHSQACAMGIRLIVRSCYERVGDHFRGGPDGSPSITERISVAARELKPEGKSNWTWASILVVGSVFTYVINDLRKRYQVVKEVSGARGRLHEVFNLVVTAFCGVALATYSVESAISLFQQAKSMMSFVRFMTSAGGSVARLFGFENTLVAKAAVKADEALSDVTANMQTDYIRNPKATDDALSRPGIGLYKSFVAATPDEKHAGSDLLPGSASMLSSTSSPSVTSVSKGAVPDSLTDIKGVLSTVEDQADRTYFQAVFQSAKSKTALVYALVACLLAVTLYWLMREALPAGESPLPLSPIGEQPSHLERGGRGKNKKRKVWAYSDDVAADDEDIVGRHNHSRGTKCGESCPLFDSAYSSADGAPDKRDWRSEKPLSDEKSVAVSSDIAGVCVHSLGCNGGVKEHLPYMVAVTSCHGCTGKGCLHNPKCTATFKEANKKKVDRRSKQRSTKPCKFGSDCKFAAKGKCVFSHAKPEVDFGTGHDSGPQHTTFRIIAVSEDGKSKYSMNATWARVGNIKVLLFPWHLWKNTTGKALLRFQGKPVLDAKGEPVWVKQSMGFRFQDVDLFVVPVPELNGNILFTAASLADWGQAGDAVMTVYPTDDTTKARILNGKTLTTSCVVKGCVEHNLPTKDGYCGAGLVHKGAVVGIHCAALMGAKVNLCVPVTPALRSKIAALSSSSLN